MNNYYPEKQAGGNYPVPSDAQAMHRAPDNVITLDLIEVFYYYLKHLPQIIIALVVGAAIAFAYTKYRVTPLYKATAQIYVVSASRDSVVNLSDLQLGTQLTGDYQNLLKIHGLIDEVNNNLGLNMSYGQIAGMISVTNPTNTRLLNITATSPSPVLSANVANEVARLATEYLPAIMECPSPHIADPAQVPRGPSSPNYYSNMMRGALALAVVYCGILFVGILSNDTLTSQEDVEKYLGELPLGVIPEGELGNFNKKRNKNLNKAERR